VGDETPASQHLGIDLGGTFIKWVVVEHDGTAPAQAQWSVLARGYVPTNADGGPSLVLERVGSVAVDALAGCPSLASTGIGVPGLYDPETGATRMLPNLPGEWDGVPVGAFVSDKVGVPTRLTNDARAFGLAELRLGAGRGASCMVGVTLGTGVGGVVAVDGRVVQGHDGTAGEIGHQIMEPDGLPCTCGGRGCLEAYARADRIEALCATATVEEAVQRALAGDDRARRGLEEVCLYLGLGIANMVATLTPDRVVIGGGISAAGELILAPIRKTVAERVFTTDVSQVEIVIAELGTWAGAIGAAVHGAEQARLA
jgi:glucokinase